MKEMQRALSGHPRRGEGDPWPGPTDSEEVVSRKGVREIPNISCHQALSAALHLPFCASEVHPTGNTLD